MTRAWSLIALLGLLVISAAQAQEPAQTILRHENFLAFSADKGEDVRIALTSMKRSGYQWANDLEVSVIDSTSTVTLQRTVALGTERVLTYRVQTGHRFFGTLLNRHHHLPMAVRRDTSHGVVRRGVHRDRGFGGVDV